MRLVMAVLVCCVVSVQCVQAQAALLGPGAGYVGFGASKIATGELDDRLASRGYPTFGQTAGALNLGAYRLLSNGVMIGLEWHGLIMGEEEHQGRDVGMAGGFGTLGIGYKIDLSSRLRIYPRAGLGGGGMSLLIQTPQDTVDFDAVLADPRPFNDPVEPNLSRDGLVYDIGAGVELLPRRKGGGPLIGLRVGYLHAPFDSSWDLVYFGKASGGPDASISGAYIRVILGGAWRR